MEPESETRLGLVPKDILSLIFLHVSDLASLRLVCTKFCSACDSKELLAGRQLVFRTKRPTGDWKDKSLVEFLSRKLQTTQKLSFEDSKLDGV